MQTIALVNQKGGVGKSTTTVNLGIGLTRQCKKGLLVDTDSQGNLTEMLGWKQIKGIFPKIEIFLKMGNREMFYTYKKSVEILI